MRPKCDCAPAGCTVGARGNTKTLDAQSVPQHVAAGKAFAVMLYNVGARSLGETRVAFARHPEWVSA